MYKLELVNKKTKEVTIFDDIVDINYGEKLFFNFEINATQLADGEYTLSLYEDGKLISTDTLCVGDFDVVGLQYKKGEAIYIETKLEAKTQDKSVEVSDIATTIIPDVGYDAMTTVEVNAQPVYDGAYNAGHTEGYESGIRAQKEKLESIEITANGVYSKEDGYNNIVVEVPDVNGSYDEGYDAGYSEGVEEGTSNAGTIIAETAQVLNITENGIYATKYSKDEDFGLDVTGYFDDVTPFYNYAYLKDKVFKTDALVTKDSKMEVWWKPNYEWDDNYYGDGIVGTIEPSYGFSLRIKNGKSFAGSVFSANDTIKEINLENKWYHLSYSYDEGLFVDGEFCGKQTIEPYPTQGVEYGYINLTRVLSNYNKANGYFGMVKIDDNIYIPTEDGFINYVTKQPLEVYQDGKYNFDEIPESDGNLIRTVNVNITPKINIQKEGITFAFSKIIEVPEWADWSNIQDMKRMFSYCDNLKNIKLIDTSNVTNMGYMCYNATKITTIPAFDALNVTNMTYMFYGCSSLLSIPLLNTSNVRDFSNFTNGCSKLTSFPAIDTSNATTFSSMFGGCTSLTTIPALNTGKVTSITSFFGYSVQNQITDFGGLVGLKTKWDDNYGLKLTPNLSYESCINILNGLYDFTGNGETPTSSQGQLKVHSNFLTTVGDEISIGTNKGWTITA